MKSSETIGALAKALATFQAKVKQPLKDKDNPFFKSKYVPLENVVEAITTSAGEHGLSFIQMPLTDQQTGNVGVITIVMHESGEWIETEAVYAKPAKYDAQGVGSVITYLRRYSLSAVFGITSDEDDDGNSASIQDNQAPPQQQAYRNNIPVPQTAQEAAAIKLSFGKHKGKTLRELWAEDKQYLMWLASDEKTDKAIAEGIGLLQLAAAQAAASKKMEQGG